MNTAKSTTQSGSESSNPMVALNSKRQMQQELINTSRAAFKAACDAVNDTKMPQQ